MQQLKVLCDHLSAENFYAREIGARTVEAGDEATRDRVGTNQKNDRDRLGRRLERMRSWCGAACDDHRQLTVDQFGGQRRESIVMILRPAIFDCYVPALDIAGVG